VVTFGLDISHHQDLGLDLAQCRRDGIDFLFIKATEGSHFVDSEFNINLARARAAGLLTAAYHYMRAGVSITDQVLNISRTVPRDVPVILDVEAGSGTVAQARSVIGTLRAIGFRVPLIYLPRWYWNQLGQPSLSGLPPLWSSRYPDNVIGLLADEWARVPAPYWNGYGGLDVAVLQFTSSARVAGVAPLDANAYRGTRAELAALLGHSTPPPTITNPAAEDDSIMKTFWVHGDNASEMGAEAPSGYEKTKWGDAMFHVDATADGLRRRHISADEWVAAEANGAKGVSRPQSWVDSIPWGAQPGLFPWLATAPDQPSESALQ
jgi:lysozyme